MDSSVDLFFSRSCLQAHGHQSPNNPEPKQTKRTFYDFSKLFINWWTWTDCISFKFYSERLQQIFCVKGVEFCLIYSRKICSVKTLPLRDILHGNFHQTLSLLLKQKPSSKSSRINIKKAVLIKNEDVQLTLLMISTEHSNKSQWLILKYEQIETEY